MPIKTNLDYLKISIKNPEPVFDKDYMFLGWNPKIDDYINATINTKKILATIDTVKSKGNDATEYYKDLFALWNGEFGGQSEFNCFLAACDTTRDGVKDFESFKIVVDMYLDNRTFDITTPKEWVQALLDSIASKSKGSCGEKKLCKIAEGIGFKYVNNWDDFKAHKKVVAIFSSSVFNMENIESNLGIKLPNEKQNKMLDIILKNGDNFAFIEAKHLKEQGGEQNKQVEELISLVQHAVNKKIYLGAFLDGVYSNKMISGITDLQLVDKKETEKISEKPKVNKQKKDMIFALNKNPNSSFWFNTAGYTEFATDFFNL